jgi:uncharacterized protein YggU (UPF0235/DUF167 family)
MRIFITIVLCFTLKFNFWAQINKLASKNYLTFSLVNGINKNSTEIVNGENRPVNAVSVVHGFNFHYTRILNPKFSLATGLGFGFLPINLKVKSFEDYEGTDVFQQGYYSRVNFKGFSRLELLASYHQKINDKYELKYSLGGGIIHYGGYGLSSSGGFQDSTGQDRNIYDINIKFNNRFKPFVSFGFEASKKLKNRDLVSLKLSYDFSFSNAYTGTYSIYDGNSTGNYFNKGNYLNLSLGYTITGNKKSERLKELQLVNKVDSKTAKKLLKKENRFIDPQSSFIAISGGMGVGGTKIESDPSGYLKKYGYPSFLPRISFEKGIKSNSNYSSYDNIYLMYVKVRASPGAKKELVKKLPNGTYEISVKEPAERNLANSKIIELLSYELKIPKNKMRIISGHHSRSKIISTYE